MKKQAYKQIGMTLMSLMLIFYLVLQLALNVGDIIEIEHATYAEVMEKAEYNAYIFRDEKAINQKINGINSFLFEDGEKVQKGQTVVYTYSDTSDASLQESIKKINNEIDILENSAIGNNTSTTALGNLDKNLSALMLDIIRAVDNDDIGKALRYKKDLTIQNNKRQALIESKLDYNKQIMRLKNEKKALEAQFKGDITEHTAYTSGYFYATLDGYENIFTIERLNSMTLSNFEMVKNAAPDTSLVNNSVGKLVINPEWYLVFKADKRTASKYTEGKKCDFAFPYSSGKILELTYERAITQTDSDTAIMIFSCNSMPKGFNYSRLQSVELISGLHKGLKISATSLRKDNGETGVYALDGNYGNKVIFKKANVLYEENGYYICALPKDPNYPDRKDKEYISKTELSLYDSVISLGKNLYEGKILQ